MKVSRHNGIKVIVSSRPWSAFESFNDEGSTLQMKKINENAIIDYLQATTGHLENLSGICWTFSNKWKSCAHHPRQYEVDAQKFIMTFINKANGNFLWTALMTSSICSHLESGLSLASLRQVVDKTPNKLEHYLHGMIYKRIDENFFPETAMMIKIALLKTERESWLSMWILLASLNQEIPSLLDKEHVYTMPYLPWDEDTWRAMFVDTKKFVDRCCRDILSVHKNEDGEYIFEGSVHFKHRSVFEFLHTPEIQKVLDIGIPDTFQNVLFDLRLAIAIAKVGHTSFNDDDRARKESISLSGRTLSNALELARRKFTPVDQGSTHGTNLLPLAREAERVAIKCLLEVGDSSFTPGASVNRWDELSLNSLKELCLELIRYDIYFFTETFLARWSDLALSSAVRAYYKNDLCFRALGLSLSLPSRTMDLKPLSQTHGKADRINTSLILGRLLDAGLDPNKGYKHILGMWYSNRSTPWCLFWQALAWNEELSRNVGFNTHDFKERFKEFSSRSNWAIYAPETLSTPRAQTALKMLLDAGAELQLSKHDPFQRRFEDARIDLLATINRWLTQEQLSKLGVPIVRQG